MITIENTQWRHVTKRSAQFVHQEVQQRIIICMSCGFCMIKMLKFCATTVLLITLKSYIKGTLSRHENYIRTIYSSSD